MSGEIPVSIIIPVFNEAETIPSLLEHIHGLQSAQHAEILIVDGSPSNDTLDAIPDNYDVGKLSSEKGRGHQMNKGAEEAQGDILIFLHADTRLPENGLILVMDSLSSESRFKAGAFSLEVDSRNIFYRLWTMIARMRTRITRIPYGDQAVFIRKDFFEELGGYKEIPLMEDVELMQRIRKQGEPIVLLREKVLTSPRRWEKEGLIRGTLRNWKLLSLYRKGVPPEKLAEYYKHGNDVYEK